MKMRDLWPILAIFLGTLALAAKNPAHREYWQESGYWNPDYLTGNDSSLGDNQIPEGIFWKWNGEGMTFRCSTDEECETLYGSENE